MIYLMSDIHGNRRRFDSVMSQIQLQSTDTLYVLGDVIDRFPDGIRILRELMKMPNVKMLIGNHEYMMLEALDTPVDPEDRFEEAKYEDALNLWYRNGGKVTHDHLKHLRKDTRSEIFGYLRSLPYTLDITVNGTEYNLVHGAPLAMYPEFAPCYKDEYQFMVWKRIRVFDPVPDGPVFIFGHTPTEYLNRESPMSIWKKGRLIDIDCGSGYPERRTGRYDVCGRLACLRLDDMREFYSDEPEWDNDEW